MRAQKIATATIALGQSLAPAVELQGAVPATILMPAAWTAAVITFQVGARSDDMHDLFDSTGVEVQVQTAAGRAVSLTPQSNWAFNWVAVRSGTSAAPVTQAAARALTLIAVWR